MVLENVLCGPPGSSKKILGLKKIFWRPLGSFGVLGKKIGGPLRGPQKKIFGVLWGP